MQLMTSCNWYQTQTFFDIIDILKYFPSIAVAGSDIVWKDSHAQTRVPTIGVYKGVKLQESFQNLEFRIRRGPSPSELMVWQMASTLAPILRGPPSPSHLMTFSISPSSPTPFLITSSYPYHLLSFLSPRHFFSSPDIFLITPLSPHHYVLINHFSQSLTSIGAILYLPTLFSFLYLTLNSF